MIISVYVVFTSKRTVVLLIRSAVKRIIAVGHLKV
jgi:hypothetical protein